MRSPEKVLFDRGPSPFPCFFLGLLILLGLGASAWAAEETPQRLREDGFVLVDGKPTWILGMYELPEDDEVLRELARSGFNLVRCPPSSEALDRVHAAGLRAWIALDFTLALEEGDSEKKQKLTEVVATFRGHPALLAWESPDEALWNVWYSRFPWVFGGQSQALRAQIDHKREDVPGARERRWNEQLEKADGLNARGLWSEAETVYESLWKDLGESNPHPQMRMSQAAEDARMLGDALTRGWEHIRSLDPEHILWQNHAPRSSLESLRHFNRAVDAAGCDIYPVPFNYGVGHSDLPEMNLTSVGAYTERMRAAAPGKSVWMVLQGFGWRDLEDAPSEDPQKGRRPTLSESRFMAWNAILHGAHAILYWGTYRIEKDSQLFQDLLRVARELRRLEPAIVGTPPERTPTVVADETFGSVDHGAPRILIRRAGDEWVLVALNETTCPIGFEVRGLPTELEGRPLFRLYSDDSRDVREGRLRDGIRPLDVHVYATTRDLEPSSP